MHGQDSTTNPQTICLIILATAVIAYSIYWLRPVLLPFVIALFVVSAITPLLDSLQRRLGANRLVAAGVTFLAGLLLMLLLGWTIWASVVELRHSGPAYRQRIQDIANTLEDKLPERLAALVSLPSAAPEGPREDAQQLIDSMLRTGVARVSAALLYLVTNGIVVLIYVFFLLLGVSNPMSSNSIWSEIDQQIRGYIRLKSIISLVTGGVFGLALAFFGVPMAVTFGVLAFLLNFIPNVGPLVATVLPIPLIMLHPDASLSWILITIAVISTIQFVSGNVFEPMLMGDSTDLHPVVILLALMFWGMMWGIVGMFLATPITAGIKLVLQRIEATRPIAAWMAARPHAPEAA